MTLPDRQDALKDGFRENVVATTVATVPRSELDTGKYQTSRSKCGRAVKTLLHSRSRSCRFESQFSQWPPPLLFSVRLVGSASGPSGGQKTGAWYAADVFMLNLTSHGIWKKKVAVVFSTKKKKKKKERKEEEDVESSAGCFYSLTAELTGG